MVYPKVTLRIINVMTAAKLISVSVIIVIGIVKLSKGNKKIQLYLGIEDYNADKRSFFSFSNAFYPWLLYCTESLQS